ncbi:Uncharacterised protein [Acinetobacter baumannii]|nr:Uncharacterised protein [Acinetobacter baumannii]
MAVGAVVGIHGAVGGVGVGEEAQLVVVEHPGDVADLRAVELGEVAVEIEIAAVHPPAGLLRAVLVDPPVGAAAQVAVDVDHRDEQQVDLLQQPGERAVGSAHVAQQHEHGVLAVGLAGMDLGFHQQGRLGGALQAGGGLVGLGGGGHQQHRVTLGAALGQLAQGDAAGGGGYQFLQVGAGLAVVAGTLEVAALGLGDQGVAGLGEVAQAAQPLLEHRWQDALAGRGRVGAVIDVGGRVGQLRVSGQGARQQDAGE